MAHIYTIEDYEIGDESESLHLLVSEEQWSSIINIFSTNFSFPTRAPHWLFGERELRIPLMQSSCYFYWSQVVCLRSVRISLQHSTIDNLQHLRKLIPRKVTQCFLMSDSFIFISHSIQNMVSTVRAEYVCLFIICGNFSKIWNIIFKVDFSRRCDRLFLKNRIRFTLCYTR